MNTVRVCLRARIREPSLLWQFLNQDLELN